MAWGLAIVWPGELWVHVSYGACSVRSGERRAAIEVQECSAPQSEPILEPPQEPPTRHLHPEPPSSTAPPLHRSTAPPTVTVQPPSDLSCPSPQSPTPRPAPPRGNKDCPATQHGPCNGVGQCQYDFGLCYCPAGWGGPDCSQPRKRPCWRMGADKRDEGWHKYPEWSHSRCAGAAGEGAGERSGATRAARVRRGRERGGEEWSHSRCAGAAGEGAGGREQEGGGL